MDEVSIYLSVRDVFLVGRVLVVEALWQWLGLLAPVLSEIVY